MSNKDINIYYQSKKLKTKSKNLTKFETSFNRKENLNYHNKFIRNKFKSRKMTNT